jgi:hypothetical protein
VRIGGRPARAAVVLLAAALSPAGVQAQGPRPKPPGPFVVDVRGASVGTPQKLQFYPAIPGDTQVPARGFGFETGVHVYPIPWGSRRIGFGVDAFLSRATASTPAPASATTTGAASSSTNDATASTPVTFPDIQVTTTGLVPSVSLNFGTAGGWSYLALGAGAVRVRSEAIGVGELTTSKASLSIGAGARWFMNDHLGVGFDLRALTFSTRALFAASAGFSLK